MAKIRNKQTVELAVLEVLQVNPGYIAQISDEVLEGQICYMHDALEGEDKGLARHIIQQFVAKIVRQKNGNALL